VTEVEDVLYCTVTQGMRTGSSKIKNCHCLSYLLVLN